MKISIVLWAGSLIPTFGEHDLDRLADDFSQRVYDAVADRFPTAQVSVRVDDGEGLETAIQISLPGGGSSDRVVDSVRELISEEWQRFDFDAYAPES